MPFMISRRPCGFERKASIAAEIVISTWGWSREVGFEHVPLCVDIVGSGESVVYDVPCIARARGLEEDHRDFLVRAGSVLNALRDDTKIARMENYDPVSEF
jgi:hypothetical protein